jgi:RNA polymerase sigma factor (sigma-70 family)
MNSSAPAFFHTTQWSMVFSAADENGAALEKLCRTYWRPLYYYARRSNHGPHESEDLVQGFLAKMLQKQSLRSASREAGPFRRFLQMTFKRYLLDEYDRATTQKRGGGSRTVPLDDGSAEQFFAREFATTETPESAYERAWALEVFSRARAALREECAVAGRAEAHDALETGEPYATLAPKLGMSTSALTSFAFRVRRRLQELIREEILQTVNSPEDLEEEVASMLRALAVR